MLSVFGRAFLKAAVMPVMVSNRLQSAPIIIKLPRIIGVVNMLLISGSRSANRRLTIKINSVPINCASASLEGLIAGVG
jgi:hypothetical protein